MSNFQGHGTVTSDGNTDQFIVRGWTTLSAHLDSGSGTWTWQFAGPDKEFRDLYAGTDGTTIQQFTGTHMINVYFGNDVLVRGVASGSSSPTWDFQVIGSIANR